MQIVRHVAGAVILLSVSGTISANDFLAEVEDQLARQNFEGAIELLDAHLADHPGYSRMRGLALYRLPDHAAAVEHLEQAHRQDPQDAEVLAALAHALRTQGRLDQAEDHAGRLIQAGHEQHGRLILGRIAEQRELDSRATSHYQAAMQGDDRDLARQAARALTNLHNRRGEHERAIQVAESALELAPDPLTASHFESMRSARPPEGRPMTLRISYRIEHDDNIPQVPENAGLFGVSDESGFRHVFTGDFAAEHPLSSRLSLFTEAYAYQSLHQDGDLDDFNFTRLRGLAGAGGTWQRFGGRVGWRVPVEVGWEGLDGSRYRTTVSALPGIHVQPREGWLFHFFSRITYSDFASPVRPGEDQGGESWRLGMFMHARPVAALQWRVVAESGSDDADGNNWELDEWRAYSFLEYQFHSRLAGGIGLQYRDRDFDNVHDVFLRRRSDEVLDAFVHVSWFLGENWRLRAQYSYQQQDSTIAAFDYKRNVFSLGLSREF